LARDWGLLIVVGGARAPPPSRSGDGGHDSPGHLVVMTQAAGLQWDEGRF